MLTDNKIMFAQVNSFRDQQFVVRSGSKIVLYFRLFW